MVGAGQNFNMALTWRHVNLYHDFTRAAYEVLLEQSWLTSRSFTKLVNGDILDRVD